MDGYSDVNASKIKLDLKFSYLLLKKRGKKESHISVMCREDNGGKNL